MCAVAVVSVGMGEMDGRDEWRKHLEGRSNGITLSSCGQSKRQHEALFPSPPRQSSSFKGPVDMCIGLVAVSVVEE